MKFIYVRFGMRAIIFGLVMALLTLGWSLGAQTPEQLITIEQKLEPPEILIKGGVSEQPQTATVTLTLAGPQVSVPVDLVLVLDRSRSVNLKTVKKIAKELMKHLSDQDRVGLVSFADSAVLDMGLNPDRKAVERTIDGLLSGRETALGEALAIAKDELITNGRAEALKIIVLPTDGLRTLGREPLAPAKRAAENNIKIFPIGISHNAKRSLLSRIAEVSGGTFFDAFSDQVLEKIFKKLSREVIARYIHVVETLSPGINFEGGPESPPKVVHKTKRGTTILEWSHSILFVGEVWAASFQISSDSLGTLAVNQEPSKVSFIGPKGRRLAQNIPLTELTVKSTATTSNTEVASKTQEPSEDLKQKIEELEQKVAALEQKLEELSQKVEALDLEAIKQELEDLKVQISALNVEAITGRLDALEQRLNELAQKVETPETEALRQDVENLKMQLSSLSNLPQLVDELRSRLDKLEGELARRPAVPENLQQDVESVKTQLGALSWRLGELQSNSNAAIGELRDKLAELEKKLAEQPPPAPTGALNTATIVTLVIIVFLVLAGFAAYEWLRRRPATVLLSPKAAKEPPKPPARRPRK